MEFRNFRKSLINKFLDLNYKIDIIVPFDKKYLNTIEHKNLKILYILILNPNHI